jgi:hypothetical protein
MPALIQMVVTVIVFVLVSVLLVLCGQWVAASDPSGLFTLALAVCLIMFMAWFWALYRVLWALFDFLMVFTFN